MVVYCDEKKQQSTLSLVFSRLRFLDLIEGAFLGPSEIDLLALPK
jgi:hypothetical protein